MLPDADQLGLAAAACEWRTEMPGGPTGLLSQLVAVIDPAAATSGSNSSGPPLPACLPVRLESLLAPYLELTAPAESCRLATTLEACYSNSRCLFEDHFDHIDCYPDPLFVTKQLTVEGGGGAAEPWPSMARTALAAQHLCNPESNVQDGHSDRPSPLDRASCSAKGVFVLPDLAALNAMAVATGLSALLPGTDDGAAPELPPGPPAAVPAPASVSSGSASDLKESSSVSGVKEASETVAPVEDHDHEEHAQPGEVRMGEQALKWYHGGLHPGHPGRAAWSGAEHLRGAGNGFGAARLHERGK
jgi:hypothetical protein